MGIILKLLLASERVNKIQRQWTSGNRLSVFWHCITLKIFIASTKRYEICCIHKLPSKLKLPKYFDIFFFYKTTLNKGQWVTFNTSCIKNAQEMANQKTGLKSPPFCFNAIENGGEVPARTWIPNLINTHFHWLYSGWSDPGRWHWLARFWKWVKVIETVSIWTIDIGFPSQERRVY